MGKREAHAVSRGFRREEGNEDALKIGSGYSFSRVFDFDNCPMLAGFILVGGTVNFNASIGLALGDGFGGVAVGADAEAVEDGHGHVQAGEPIDQFGDGTTRRDYTYIDDITAGVRAAIDYDKTNYEVINLGESRTVELRELISLLEKALGRRAEALDAAAGPE